MSLLKDSCCPSTPSTRSTSVIDIRSLRPSAASHSPNYECYAHPQSTSSLLQPSIPSTSFVFQPGHRSPSTPLTNFKHDSLRPFLITHPPTTHLQFSVYDATAHPWFPHSVPRSRVQSRGAKDYHTRLTGHSDTSYLGSVCRHIHVSLVHHIVKLSCPAVRACTNFRSVRGPRQTVRILATNHDQVSGR